MHKLNHRISNKSEPLKNLKDNKSQGKTENLLKIFYFVQINITIHNKETFNDY
jgi:hypothetical protein